MQYCWEGENIMHVHVHKMIIVIDFIYLFIFCRRMKFCVNLTAFGKDFNL